MLLRPHAYLDTLECGCKLMHRAHNSAGTKRKVLGALAPLVITIVLVRRLP